MKKKYLLGLILIPMLLLGFITSVYTQDDNIPQSRFAFYHASPNAPEVDVYVGNDVLFSNVGFNTKTPFEIVAPGDLTVSVNIAGTDQTVLGPVKATVKQGRDHILFVTGVVEGSDNTDMPLLTAKILVKKTRPAFFRFYNTSPDAGDVNVYLGKNLYFENVGYGQPTKFEKVGSGKMELIVKRGDEDIVMPTDVDFEAGKVYSVILVGMEDGQGLTSLKVEVVEE